MSFQKIFFLQGFTRILTDCLSAFLAWCVAYTIRPLYDLIPGIHLSFTVGNLPPMESFAWFAITSSVALILIFSVLRLYEIDPKVGYFSESIFYSIFLGVFLWSLSIVATYSLIFHELFFSRVMLFHASLFAIVFIIIFRIFLHWFFENIFVFHRKSIIWGNPEEKKMLSTVLSNTPFVVQKEDSQEITDVFFFESSYSHQELQSMREECVIAGKNLFIVPSYASNFWGHAFLEVIEGVPMIYSTYSSPKYWWFFWKRVFDITFSIFFLIVFSPVFLLASIAIYLESPGPVFYISTRVGKNGKPFSIIKFRSMYLDADKRKEELLKYSHRSGPFFKMKDDPRITTVGKWIRKTSIDEFPNFINVLKGDMSIIGPRPHLQNEVDAYTKTQKRVLSVRPGISGLAQVSGRSDLSFEQEMIFELYYTENLGFGLDMKIFFKTPFVLLKGKGAD